MQVITDLLATGKYSNRQVAEMANTTAAYVAKIKSQIKNRLDPVRITTASIDDITSKGGSIELKQGETTINRPNKSLSQSSSYAVDAFTQGSKHSNQKQNNRLPYSITGSAVIPEIGTRSQPSPSSLSKLVPDDVEERKKLWKEFNDKTPFPMIIEKHGYSSDAVIREYNIFEKYSTGYTIDEIQKQIITSISNRLEALDKYSELAGKYKQLLRSCNEKHYLTSKEISEAISLSNQLSYEIGIDSVSNTTKRTPKGWTRLICSVCSEPLSGIVVDLENAIGQNAKEQYKNWRHSKCTSTAPTTDTNRTQPTYTMKSDIRHSKTQADFIFRGRRITFDKTLREKNRTNMEQ